MPKNAKKPFDLNGSIPPWLHTEESEGYYNGVVAKIQRLCFFSL